MSTPTVLRVKRRLEDDPQDALVLLCKRMKTDTDEITSVFIFRGSVESQETADVKNIVPSNSKQKNPTNVTDIIQKIRKERKDFATESRYEIVKCSRGIEDDTTEDDIDVVDLLKKDEEENDKYIYDLYTAPKDDFNISMVDNIIGIENYDKDQLFGCYRDNGLEESDDDESADSNAENNCRNEYPDSDPSTIDDEDMIKVVENCKLEDNLSGDTDEDNIYDGRTDLFNEDVKRFGEAYAKYKAKVVAEENQSSSNNFVQSTEQEGYKDKDSDGGFFYGDADDYEQFYEMYGSDESFEIE